MKICKINIAASSDDAAIQKAAQIIKGGGVVAFPTDTFYGLAANPFDGKAVDRLFDIKNRPRNNPIMILISDESQLGSLVQNVPESAKTLMKRFWPGPLTIVFPCAGLPDILCGGSGNIGIRFPLHRVSTELIRQSGTPITATSANISGGANPTTAQDVFESIGEKVDLILDGGKAAGSLASTVVKVGNKIEIIREGQISKIDLLGK